MDEYQITCECGAKTPIHVGQCGLTVPCEVCREPVKVPDLITLKRLAGDPYPHLSAVDKVEATVQNGEQPFDGVCQQCQAASASRMFPVSLFILEERDLEDHGGVSIPALMVGRIQKKLAAGTEYWRRVDFPLLLCTACAASYTKERTAKKRMQIFGALTCGLALLLLTWWVTADVAVVAIVGIALLVALAAVVLRREQAAKRAAPVDLNWLSPIRWVDEVLRTQDEYRLVVREPREFRSVDTLR